MTSVVRSMAVVAGAILIGSSAVAGPLASPAAAADLTITVASESQYRSALSSCEALGATDQCEIRISGPFTIGTDTDDPVYEGAADLLIRSTGSQHVLSGVDGVDVPFLRVIGDGSLTVRNVAFQGFAPGDFSVGGTIFVDSSDVTLENTLFTGNAATGGAGGGLFANNGNVLVISSVFTENQASWGAAVWAQTGDVAILDSTFHANSATTGGGALALEEGNLQVSNSVFTNNSANQSGGAIRARDDITIDDSTFSGNIAVHSSGGAITADTGIVTITGTVFDNNSSGHTAGAISNYLAELTLIDSQFTGNESNWGGALYTTGGFTSVGSTFVGNRALTSSGGAAFVGSGQTHMEASTFKGNSANGGGGAIAGYTVSVEAVSSTFVSNTANYGGALTAEAGSVSASNSTFVGNSASTQGGAVYLSTVDLDLEHVTLVNNAAPTGAHLRFASDVFNITGSVMSAPLGGGESCMIHDLNTVAEAHYSWATDDSCWTTGSNNITNGTDPQLSNLRFAGGATQTLAPAAGSPLIDAIPTSAGDCVTGVTNDQRGDDRPKGTHCDIGAVEADAPFSPPGVPTFDDVPTSHPFFDAIEWFVAEGITEGYPDGTFRPSGAVSRQAMAAFVQRVAGGEGFVPPSTPTFSDVPTTHPFFDAIEWFAAEGITEGYPDGTFRPSASVSRQAMAAFVQRVAVGEGYVPPSTPTFSDVPTSHPFFAAIEWFAAEGITEGYPDGTFRPSASVSRQAMAAFLQRAYS